ncbi:glycoside hydrolase family 57 protein [Tenuifilum thalassicum]|uniref:Polysaccharide deacetylase family protein n=1 Tax=Tenuifilum thalassicum TaxID=2590900 RepID=A0A7D4BAB1_9BACT|nr:polysaccharide deacetylase family protein [Tenuifilum thalassicum]
MKTICFYFQVHQPFRLRRYRFFDIGKNHDYFDDFANKSIMRKVAEKCYLPTNKLMLDLIKEYGLRFKIAYSISGTALDQFELYAPDVLESFQKLAETGSVEFLAETYSHSLSALKSREEFTKQVKAHTEKLEKLIGYKPKAFRNTELIYSDEIGAMVADLGFNTMLTEGAKHILGWKSPNFVYSNAINPKLRLLLKNFRLSDDIAFRFSNRDWSEWPLTTEKYVHWLNNINPNEEIVNLFMDYETFGEHQWAETGIFDFMRALPDRVFTNSNFEFLTPSEAAQKHQPVALLHVPHPISWADEERDLTAWLGNELQDSAFNELYSLAEMVEKTNDPDIKRDWLYLQTSDHFYYMCTKWFSDGDVHKYFNPYDSPYDAFINYMNVLSDFTLRLKKKLIESPVEQNDIENTENALKLIELYREKIEELQSELNEENEPAKSNAVKDVDTETSTKLSKAKDEKPKRRKSTKSKSSTSTKSTGKQKAKTEKKNTVKKATTKGKTK